jgi:hypothetical protein
MIELRETQTLPFVERVVRFPRDAPSKWPGTFVETAHDKDNFQDTATNVKREREREIDQVRIGNTQRENDALQDLPEISSQREMATG